MRTLLLAAIILAISCQQTSKTSGEAIFKDTLQEREDSARAAADILVLPQPNETPSVKKFSKVTGWPDNTFPQAPEGFAVHLFAGDLDNPRSLFVADNGDVFVAESSNKSTSANRITLLRDADGDGVPEVRSVFLKKLNMPFGIFAHGNSFYVGNTDGIMKYAYTPGNTEIIHPGKQIIKLPAGEQHWTRNVIGNAEGNKLYITVGSASNIAEKGMDKEDRRAAILEVNSAGQLEKKYATGLRNPVGLAWAPGTETLWVTVNERDGLGDELVPDYLTSVQQGGFYGWPYSYYGQHIDPRVKDTNQSLIKSAIVPDLQLGAHTASLGLAFYKGNFPKKYTGGAFIAQHGSWNRSSFSGYKVIFVPFKGNKPSGKPEDFLTGFIADESKSKVYGRPAGIAVMKDGSLLVADDAGNKIWRISYKK